MNEQKYQEMLDKVQNLNQKIEVANSKAEMLNAQRAKQLVELGYPPALSEEELSKIIAKAEEKAQQAYDEMEKAIKEKQPLLEELEEAINDFSR